jgi:hypothetical protein
MPAQENQDPYHGEDPSALAKELGISLKALEGLFLMEFFNTPADIRLSLRVGLDPLAEEGILEAVHEGWSVTSAIRELRFLYPPSVNPGSCTRHPVCPASSCRRNSPRRPSARW